MGLYDFYIGLSKKVLEDFKKVIEKNGETATPLKVKKRLSEKLSNWMGSKDAPSMTDIDKHYHITVSRTVPNNYTIRIVYGVNKVVVITKYDSKENKFVQYVTKEGTLAPKVDI